MRSLGITPDCGAGVLVMLDVVAKGAGVVVNKAKVDDVRLAKVDHVRLQQLPLLGIGVPTLYEGVVVVELNNSLSADSLPITIGPSTLQSWETVFVN
jgi:hypothetical protein